MENPKVFQPPLPPPPLDEILGEFRINYALLFRKHCSLPSNPGKDICMNYKRTGECASGGGVCRFDHPMERFEAPGSLSSAQKVVQLLDNLCILCTNIKLEAISLLTSFVSNVVVILDKYFDDLNSDYGAGCIIFGDSVPRLRASFNSFRKRHQLTLTALNNPKSEDKFESECKTLHQCLKYMNARWEEYEHLFASDLHSSLRMLTSRDVLLSLDNDIASLAARATDSENNNKERRETIRVFLLSVANSVVNAHVRSRNKSLVDGCVLKPFGSSASSLCTSSSDLDLCLGYDETIRVRDARVLFLCGR